MDDLDLRHHVGAPAGLSHPPREIDVVEEQRVPLVERHSQPIDEPAGQQEKRGAGLVDGFGFAKGEVTAEVSVLEVPTEHEAVDRPSEAVVVGEHVQRIREPAVELLQLAVRTAETRRDCRDLRPRVGLGDKHTDGVSSQQDVVVGD